MSKQHVSNSGNKKCMVQNLKKKFISIGNILICQIFLFIGCSPWWTRPWYVWWRFQTSLFKNEAEHVRSRIWRWGWRLVSIIIYLFFNKSLDKLPSVYTRKKQKLFYGKTFFVIIYKNLKEIIIHLEGIVANHISPKG